MSHLKYTHSSTRCRSNSEYITLILFFLTVWHLIHLFSFPGASRGSEAPSARGSLHGKSRPEHTTSSWATGWWRGPAESRMGPSPLAPTTRGAGHLHLCTCNLISWHHLLPQHTKMGEASLAQLPHKSSSAPTVLMATTSPSVTVNFNSHLQGADKTITTRVPRGMLEKVHSTPHWYCYTPMLPATSSIKYKKSERTQLFLQN